MRVSLYVVRSICEWWHMACVNARAGRTCIYCPVGQVARPSGVALLLVYLLLPVSRPILLGPCDQENAGAAATPHCCCMALFGET